MLVALLVVATLASRIPFFGSAILHKDDQFYLLVGQAMLQGDLPYVDIWDRKPIGLFLIYAAIAALGQGVIPYQLVACFLVLITSLVICRIALRVSDFRGAAIAGLLYILLLPALGGESGQSPIFYNLLIAGAALLTLDAFDQRRGPTAGRAAGAMLLCGLAMTVKQTTLFEGIAFGLLHLWAMRRDSSTWGAVAMRAAPMVAIALAPTLMVFLAYALLGHLEDLWQATVLSVFAKAPIPPSETNSQILRQVGVLSVPLLAAAAWLTLSARDPEARWRLPFFLTWGLGALLGYLSVPNFFDHYALPLTVPLSVMAGAGFAFHRNGPRLFALTAAVLCFAYWPWTQRVDLTAPAARLTANVATKLKGGCLYVYAGPVYLYRATGACRSTRFAFPDHLESAAEATALPVDPAVEVARILDKGPAVIVTAPRFFARNPRVEVIVNRALACRYDRGYAVSIIGSGPVVAWQRRSAPRPGCQE